ncbi:NCEH1-like protein [Mya arenaria]|uniref:NCEH1-like protein n=1 Tax=Mya arenaria TaxID=6604 RepID=A0ABY7EP01_MYAAR|nr:NCEH1-like protein [Mya arenaria]
MRWRTWIVLGSLVALLLAARVYRVLHRPVPPELEQPEVIRWLDEGGRWANILIRYTTVDNIPVTIFLPDSVNAAGGNNPTMVYFHGDVYSGFLANFAEITGLQIIAVEYRKAPQHIFPAAYHDCLTATLGVLKRADDFRLLAGKLIIGGDGGGGNLAAAVSNTLGDKIWLQLLINPALQVLDFETPSYQDYDENVLPGLSSAFRNVYHWLEYAGISQDYLQFALQNTHISSGTRHSVASSFVNSRKYLPRNLTITDKTTRPLKSGANFIVTSAFDKIATEPKFAPMMSAKVEGTPNAYMVTSQYDVYRDEGIMYAQRLFESHIDVKLEHYYESFHGFVLFSGYGPIKLNVAERAIKGFSDFLKALSYLKLHSFVLEINSAFRKEKPITQTVVLTAPVVYTSGEVEFPPRRPAKQTLSGAYIQDKNGEHPLPGNDTMFESGILEASLYIIKRGFNFRTTQSMGDPVLVTRVLSNIVNADENGGVLKGLWSTNDFQDGRSPTTWSGSVAILKQYLDNVISAKGVCRALGIPCRCVTNYNSGRGTDGRLAIDFYYEMKEDGTIDEIESEENDDLVWCTQLWTSPASGNKELVGNSISSKTPDGRPPLLSYKYNLAEISRVRQDVTSDYKYKKGTEMERQLVKRPERKPRPMHRCRAKDVVFKLENKEFEYIGADFYVKAHVTNTSSESRDVHVVLSCEAVHYNGRRHSLFKKLEWKLTLGPTQEEQLKLPIYADDYIGRLAEHTCARQVGYFRCEDTDQIAACVDEFLFEKPHLELSVEETVHKNSNFELKLQFKNPLHKQLTACAVSVEGAGLESSVFIRNFKNVPALCEWTGVVNLLPVQGKSLAISATFHCQQMFDIVGFLSVRVEKAIELSTDKPKVIDHVTNVNDVAMSDSSSRVTFQA